MKVSHVTLMEPVESRNVKHVMPSTDALVTRMRYMGVCVTRIRIINNYPFRQSQRTAGSQVQVMGLKGMKCWGFLTKLMKKTLGFTPCCQAVGNQCWVQAMKMFVLWSKSQAVAKLEPLDKLENCLGWMHQNISGSLQNLLDVVPTTKSLGEVCGADIQWLQGKKGRSENDLFWVRDAQNKRVIKMCGLQADDVLAKDPGEVLQTTTVPLNEVRNELGIERCDDERIQQFGP